jgi:hypothetical protein
MSAQKWRPLDDISVKFQASETDGSDNRVIEFSTWCGGEYCEPVRITQRRAAELMTSLAQALQRSKRPALDRDKSTATPWSPPSRLIWIESRWIDCHLVRVQPPGSYEPEGSADLHAGGYSMRYATRLEALICASRECSQWLQWAVDNQALDAGQQLAELALRFMTEARRGSEATC